MGRYNRNENTSWRCPCPHYDECQSAWQRREYNDNDYDDNDNCYDNDNTQDGCNSTCGNNNNSCRRRCGICSLFRRCR